MIIREATVADIPQMQFIRNSVRENQLSDPALVPDQDYVTYMDNRGRGWVCELGGKITGFAIADLQDKNIWALFLHPDFEKKGMGRRLHDTMMEWYFSQTTEDAWLGTAPGTRAESFYRKAGWKESGTHGKGEIKFVMSRADWIARNAE